MSPAVLVTAPTMAPEAAAALTDVGLAVHHTQAYPDEAALVAAVRALRPVALIVRQGRITAPVLDAAAPALRVVARHGAGMDGIDVAAARARGLPVTRAAGANAAPVAEHAITVLLALIKDLPGTVAAMRAGAWERNTRAVRDLAGFRLGLLGYGAIARRVATLATALGLDVAAHSPTTPIAQFAPTRRLATLADLLAHSEALSLHCPLTPATRGLLGAPELAALPPGAILINTARGGLVDEPALLAALDSGHLAAAALDTFATEPLPPDHPLRHHPRVLATPHLAGATPAGHRQIGLTTATCILAILAGTPPPAGCQVA